MELWQPLQSNIFLEISTFEAPLGYIWVVSCYYQRKEEVRQQEEEEVRQQEAARRQREAARRQQEAACRRQKLLGTTTFGVFETGSSKTRSSLVTLKELLRGDSSSPRIPNLEPVFVSFCEAEPRKLFCRVALR